MGDHFKQFTERQKQSYLDKSLQVFEDSLKPLAGQLFQVFTDNDFEERLPAIKALVKRCSHYYNICADDAKAPERERIALEEGGKWIKGLSATMLEGLKASNPDLARVLEKG